METIAGSPSGIAATAKLIAVINISNVSRPCKKPMRNIIAQMATATKPKYFPTCAKLFEVVSYHHLIHVKG